MKPMTQNQKNLLEFIVKRHEDTGHPVSEHDVALAGVVPSRTRIRAACGLLSRGLIAVPRIGTAAWVPTTAAKSLKVSP
jgi:hypothetical protein